MVASSDNSSEVYCVNGEKVILYDTITQESKIVQQLNYQPTSMTVAHGFLATGGTKSEVSAVGMSCPPSRRTMNLASPLSMIVDTDIPRIILALWSLDSSIDDHRSPLVCLSLRLSWTSSH